MEQALHLWEGLFAPFETYSLVYSPDIAQEFR